MRPARKQFLDRRRAFGMGNRQADPPCRRHIVARAERTGHGRELTRQSGVPDLRVGIGAKLAQFDTHPGFEPQRAADQSLKREDAGLALLCVGQEFLFTGKMDVFLDILDAARAAPA